MKRIIITMLLLLLLKAADAQLTGWVPFNSKAKYLGIAGDSLMYVPARDTNFTPQRKGAIVMRPADSIIYVGISTTAPKKWDRLARYTELGGGTFVDSVKYRNDSLFYYKGGTEYYADLKGVNLKLNISDTASMLSPYLRKIDTTNKWITQVYRKTASDSVFYVKGGNHTFAFIDSTGGGVSLAKDLNPSNWLVSPSARAQHNWPEFYTSGGTGDHAGSYYETSMYTPSPIKLNSGKLITWTKGDLNKVIYGWQSLDNGITWDTLGQSLSKGGTGTFDEFSIAMPMAHHIASTDSIYLYYAGIPAFPYENGGLGLAVSAGSTPNTLTKKKQALSIPDFKTQMGISGYNLIYISLGSIVKQGSEYYYYGGYWNAGFGMTDSTIRIWEGHSNSLDTIKNCREILHPTAQYTMYDMPTVYHGADSSWYMIFTKGWTDENGGIDSSAYLVSAVSTSLSSSNFTELPGRLYEHDADSTWKGKRVYNAKLLKDEYGTPYLMKRDSVYGYPADSNEPFYMLFYSGSYTNSYHDQSSYLKLMPQTDSLTFGVGYNGDKINMTRRGTSTLLNIPFVDSTKDGQLSKDDWSTFYGKADSSGNGNYIQNNKGSIAVVQPISNFHISGIGWAENFIVGDYPYSKYGVINGDATAGMQLVTQRLNLRSEAGLFFNSVMLDTRASSTITTPYIFNSNHVTGYSTAITQNNYSTFNVGDIVYPTIPQPFNTTSSALTNYAARFINYGHRTSGSNALTNVAAYFEADSAQNNNALITGNGKIGFLTPTPDSLVTVNGSFHVVGNAKFDGKIHAPNLAAGNGTKAVRWDATEGFVLADTTTGGGGGYTNLTQFVAQNNWKTFYSDGSGDVQELSLGAANTHLVSTGASSAPTFERYTRVLQSNVTDVGNVGAGEDDLMTYSIPASTLSSDGDYIEFTMTVTFAANSNNKQVKLYYGGTTVYASGAQAQNNGTMELVGRIVRTGATSQRISVSVRSNTTNFPDYADYTTASETLSGAVTLKLTGEATSNDDIVQKINTVEFKPKN